jgi:predicted nuclease with TOPRIM domain
MDRKDDGILDELRQRLEEWNMGLDELQATVDRAEAERNARLSERLQALRDDYDRARTRFADPPREKEGEWDELRSGMEEARRLLDAALEESRGGGGET